MCIEWRIAYADPVSQGERYIAISAAICSNKDEKPGIVSYEDTASFAADQPSTGFRPSSTIPTHGALRSTPRP